MKIFTKPLPLSSWLRELIVLTFILLNAIGGVNAQQYASGRLSVKATEEYRPQLFAFGIGLSGRLGTGNENDQNSPVSVNNANDWKQVSAGVDYSLAIKKDGTLWAWGSGSYGRLGTGNTEDQYFPVRIGESTDWEQINAGTTHSLAIKSDGTLWAWGNGSSGRLGTGDENYQYHPVQVGDEAGWRQVTAGFTYSLAIKSDGSLWAWGSGSFVRLGTGTTDDQYRPVRIGEATDWKQVSLKESHSLAIKSDGTLWAWGSGSSGRLGTGNEERQYHPVQIGEATNWTMVSAGRWHSVAIKSDGTLWAWGQLIAADNDRNTSDELRPVQVGVSTDWKYVSAGQDHSLAIKADGTLWSWGHGADGALGTGGIRSQHSPVQIGEEVYSYASAGGFHSLAMSRGPISPDANGIFYIKKGSIGNGSSWENATSELAEAIDISHAGQEIWVAAGEYQPASGQSFSMKKGVKIYGGFAPVGSPAFTDRNWKLNVTTLRGNGKSVVRNDNNELTESAVLDGFVITGGTDWDGGGISNKNVSPLLSNLKIIGNNSQYGGGLHNEGASPLVINTVISNNNADFGGGVYNISYAHAQFYNVLISENSSVNYGGGMLNSGSSPKLVNATFARNSSGDLGSSMLNSYGSFPTLTNGIVWSNSGPGHTIRNILNQSTTSSLTISYSILQGSGSHNWAGEMVGTDGGHNLDADPLFADPNNGDYSLRVPSPAINAGSNLAIEGTPAQTTDYIGNTRIVGNRVDMGMAELQDLSSITIRYVNQTGIGNGLTWANASSDLQEMINESATDNQVWVATGEYQAASEKSFTMKEGVKIYGGFAATGNPAFSDRNWNQHVTILKGNGNSVIVNDNNGLTNAALLDGFSITGGSAVTGGGMLNHLSYPLINHCVFKANHATVWGGGIYNDGPGMTTIVNSLFYQNTAQSGGAAFSYQNAKPRFTNVTITSNAASQNGGALHNYEGAETELVNAIVWDNVQSPSSSQLFTSGSGKTKAYFSVLQGGAQAIIGDKEAVDIVSENPLFADAANGNFALQGCSPALNIGSTGVLSGFNTDLIGNARIFDRIVDAGAYEYQAISLTGANRLSVNGYTTSVTISSGQTYHIQATGDVCRSVAMINSNGDAPVNGIVNITTHIDNTVQTYNGSPYVQRYYDISPVNDAATATARVTLYFTQKEFSDYNTSLGRTGLPSGPNEGAGSMRVFQYHGVPEPDQSGPAAYQGNPTTITPELRWNYGLERWEVSFDVRGFSGFFIGSMDAPLPVKLVSFKGVLTEMNSVSLQWQVADQVDIDNYTVECSYNGRDFTAIGHIQANPNAESYYQYTDNRPHLSSIAYYRLKMTELDGSYAYSRIISVTLPRQNSNVLAYPIPAHDFVRIKGKDITGTSMKLLNSQGVILKIIQVRADDQEINISFLPSGVYFITTNSGYTLKIVKN